MNNTEIKYCALPGCNRVVTNWRMKCCCRSHQGTYSAKSRHGTLHLPNKLLPKTKRQKIIMSDADKKSKWAAYVSNRQHLRNLSMPPWADKNKILEFYKEARKLTLETGIKYEVDHIIPSNHSLVCGLHNEFNLQILTESENCKKSNKFEII